MLPLTRPESRGTGARPAKAAKAVHSGEGFQITAGGREELRPEHAPHARHATDHSRMRVLATPGLDQSVELGDFLVEGQLPPSQRRATVIAASFSSGSAVCWAWAASTAARAISVAPLTLRFFSQVVMRRTPARRMAAGDW